MSANPNRKRKRKGDPQGESPLSSENDEDPTDEAPSDIERDPSAAIFYSSQIFQSAVGYLIYYFENILNEVELSAIRKILSLPQPQAEIILRLACRVKGLFLEEKITADYDHLVQLQVENIEDFLEEISKEVFFFVEPHSSNAIDDQQNLIEYKTGSDLMTVDRQPSPNAQKMFKLLRVFQLKEMTKAVKDVLFNQRDQNQRKNGVKKEGKRAPDSDVAAPNGNTKVQLIQFLLDNISVCPPIWDALIGKVVSVAPSLRTFVRHIFRLFQVITGDVQMAAAGSRTGGSPPVLPPGLLLFTLRKAYFPMEEQIRGAVEFTSNGLVAMESYKKLPPLFIFESRESLEIYLEGLQLEETIFDLQENRHPKLKNSTFITHLDATIEAGLEKARRIQAKELQGGEIMVLSVDENSQEMHEDEKTATILNLLSSKPNENYHLSRFLPTYRWYSCVETLVSFLESQKRYERALLWLSQLLDVPLLPSKAGVDSIYFRVQRRGYFHHRVMMNLDHFKREKEAISHAEKILAYLLTDAAKHDILHYLRRADRISVERTMLRLFVPPRRWGNPPATLYKRLYQAREVTIHSQRMGSQWRSIWLTGEAGSSSVESCALRWYLNGRGRKEKNWNGLHCEGSWVSTLFTVLFYDALYGPDAQSNFTYLTPFQSGPFDLSYPRAFYLRRKAIIDERLEYFENCPRQEFLQHVLVFMKQVKQARKLKGLGDQASEDPKVTANNKENQNLAKNSYNRLSMDLQADEVAMDWSLPLEEIAVCVPQRCLCKMFKKMMCSELQEGQSIRFSGFPDLCLWRTPQEFPSRTNSSSISLEAASSGSFLGASNFLLSEVKSPNDKLSDKQHAVIDMLLECGFEVEVAHVTDEVPEHPIYGSPESGDPTLTHAERRRRNRTQIDVRTNNPDNMHRL